jgi:cyclic pyranopterin phosphate synthase
MANDLKHAGLHRINISLDSLNEKTYAAITCGGILDRTLSGIAAALRANLPVKLNSVVLRNYNAVEEPALARFALERGCGIRFLELMPIGCASTFFDAEFVAAADVRKILAEHFTFTPVRMKSQDSHTDFLAEDREGRRGIVGFISPHSTPFCAGCTRLRLTSTGELIPCLAHGDGTNIRHLLAQTTSDVEETKALHNPLIALVAQMLTNKGERKSFRTTRAMACVGG